MIMIRDLKVYEHGISSARAFPSKLVVERTTVA